MSQTPPTPALDSNAHQGPGPGRVQIRVRGHLEARWSDWLDGLALSAQHDGTTVITGTVVDQAALFGVIHRLRDMAVPLISITHLDPTPPAHDPGAKASTGTEPTTTPARPRRQP